MSASRVCRFFPMTRTSLPRRPAYLIAHAKEQVFVLLVIGGKGVLVEQHQFRVIRAHFREVRKLRSDVRNQARFSLHALVIGHRAMRIADPEPVRIPQMEMTPRLTSPQFC